MNLVIIDYGSGNLRSASKALEKVKNPNSKVYVTKDPEIVAKVKQAFYTYKWDDNFKKEFKRADRFINIRHATHWDVIRKIDAANGIKYDCK